jgi:hypothetical protein
MRRRNQFKPPDPADEIQYAESFKKLAENARDKMSVFDKLPPAVRRAMTEEPTGSISAHDVATYVGIIPDHTLALAVMENGKAVYRQQERDYARSDDFKTAGRMPADDQSDHRNKPRNKRVSKGTKKPRK